MVEDETLETVYQDGVTSPQEMPRCVARHEHNMNEMSYQRPAQKYGYRDVNFSRLIKREGP